MRGKERAEVLNKSLALGYCGKKGKYVILDKISEGILNRKGFPLLVNHIASLSLIYWPTHKNI